MNRKLTFSLIIGLFLFEFEVMNRILILLIFQEGHVSSLSPN